MPAKPKTFDECLAAVGKEQRAALEALRKTIHAAAPEAEEYVGYGLAAFRLNGKPLVALGATAKHCAFYLMSGSMVETHQELLAKYDTSKGTIRFPSTKPLPATLVRKLVKARIAENDSLLKKTKSAKKPVAKSTRRDPAVDEYLRTLRHPRTAEVEALRHLILGVSKDFHEGIKWNSLSFRTTDYFATINLTHKDQVRLILHRDAKVKASATDRLKIADPDGLLQWLGKDRCLVTIEDAGDLKLKRTALVAIFREWTRYL